MFPETKSGMRPFKFFKMWCDAPDFIEKVKACWDEHIPGTRMFSVVQRLKKMKMVMKSINKEGYSDIQAADARAYAELMEYQKSKGRDRDHEREQKVVQEYRRIHDHYLSFLNQKAKINWIKEGDDNTAMFHRAIKQRRMQNIVYSINNMLGGR